MNFSDPLRRAREDAVAFIQGDETGNMGNDLIEAENHITAMALLPPLTVEFHAKGDVIRMFQRTDFLEFTYRRRIVKGLGYLPRMAFGLALALQVAGSEVDAYGHCIIITVGEAHGDVLTQPTDTHHHLRLVVDTAEMVRDKEGFALIKDGGICLGEYHGLVRPLQRSV